MIIDQNFIDCTCPHCNALVSFPQSFGGLVQACPNCLEDLIPPATEGKPAQKLPLPITTSKLVMRRLTGADWQALMQCIEEDDEERVAQWLERDAQIRLTTPDATFCLALELRNGGAFAGYFGLRLTTPRLATVNFVIHAQYQQTDLPVEGLKALLGFCFRSIGLHRVSAMLVDTDIVGAKLCEGAGMRREAVFLKDTETPEGEWLTSVWYAMLQDEFHA